MHISDTHRLIARVTSALAPGGCVAFEEACLETVSRAAGNEGRLADLERLWAGRFLSRETWLAALNGAGLEVVTTDDLTGLFLAHFERAAHIARTRGADAYPAHEAAAFDHAVKLASVGAIGYCRFVARRR